MSDEDQQLWLRRYHQAELMRIGLRDILGLADFEQYLTELSESGRCLPAIRPRSRAAQTPAQGRRPSSSSAWASSAGRRLTTGRTLTSLFVADSKAKNLPALGRLALEVLDLVSARTEQGVVFRTDARLRPDGEKGLLVNTLSAYEEYYRQRGAALGDSDRSPARARSRAT